MATQPSAVTSLRMLALYFGVAIVPVWAVVAIVVPALEPGWSTGPATSVASVVGLATLGGSALLASRVEFSSTDAFAQSYPRATMFQLAIAGVAGLVGFVMTIVSASAWPYAVGFVAMVVGLYVATPTAARLDRIQAAADADGAPIDVVRVLVEKPLFR